MKSSIFVTTAANRRDPIVLWKILDLQFLAPQIRALFLRFSAQTVVYRESCRGLSGISFDALSLTTVDQLLCRSFTLFSALPGNYKRNTLHARQSNYWKYASTIRLVLRLVDAGWHLTRVVVLSKVQCPHRLWHL